MKFASFVRLYGKTLCFSIVILFLYGAVFSASAATITVNTTVDEDNTGANCSLREAVEAAKTDAPHGGCTAGSGADIINFSALFNTPQTITLTSQILVNIATTITINGPGANLLTVSPSYPPNGTNRAFFVSSANLSASGFTISGALGGGGGGGGFLVQSNATLTITNVIITGNTTTLYGGAISSNDTTTTINVINSTISNNTAGGSAFGGGGGGIDNSGTLNITNSTISGNSKIEATANGGGIYNVSGTTTITNSTITNNTAAGAGSAGGIFRLGGTVIVRNSIIAANVTTPDVAGAFTSSGYNLIGNLGTATGFTATGDQTGVSNANAGLAPLANNGGPTPTHLLNAGSFAIDKGSNFGSTTDQRGMTRPFDNPSIPNAPGGNGTDIGAFEVQMAVAAGITVSGRVVNESGRGIKGAIVYFVDQNGANRTAVSNAFGYFSFSDVEVGQTYVISVFSKNYQFLPMIITPFENLSDLTITAQPGETGTSK